MPIFLGTMLVSLATSAHHSIGAFYDYDNPRELEGTITDIRWINPHVRFTLETVNDNGDIESWQLELGSVNMLERQGVLRSVVEIGDRIAVAGYASRHGRKDMIDIAAYVALVRPLDIPDEE